MEHPGQQRTRPGPLLPAPARWNPCHLAPGRRSRPVPEWCGAAGHRAGCTHPQHQVHHYDRSPIPGHLGQGGLHRTLGRHHHRPVFRSQLGHQPAGDHPALHGNRADPRVGRHALQPQQPRRHQPRVRPLGQPHRRGRPARAGGPDPVQNQLHLQRQQPAHLPDPVGQLRRPHRIHHHAHLLRRPGPPGRSA
ncbi:hypothetical protein DR66_3738 [Delftia acidovorans]|nr:hypothetical protein DR66_3738 [Delftia acidovorans]